MLSCQRFLTASVPVVLLVGESLPWLPSQAIREFHHPLMLHLDLSRSLNVNYPGDVF